MRSSWRGCVYLKKAWTQRHYAWLRQLTGAVSPLVDEDRVVCGEYLALFEYKLGRREDLDQRITQLALTPALAPAVARVQCFRGIDVHSATVLATELVDWRRFTSPRKLMSDCGLVPREHSSGERERRGAITKAGNSHVRHVLVQAAWSYRHVPKVGVGLKARQQGQSPRVIAHTWKAQHRRYTLYHRLHAKRPPQIAAVVRALMGFLWSVMQDRDHLVPQTT